MMIYIPFTLFKSNRVGFEKYKSGILLFCKSLNKTSIQYFRTLRLFLDLGFDRGHLYIILLANTM